MRSPGLRRYGARRDEERAGGSQVGTRGRRDPCRKSRLRGDRARPPRGVRPGLDVAAVGSGGVCEDRGAVPATERSARGLSGGSVPARVESPVLQVHAAALKQRVAVARTRILPTCSPLSSVYALEGASPAPESS
jgi:hypothetical protein